MFSPSSREAVRNRLFDRAQEDERVAGTAITGSGATGHEDDWSDIDIAVGLKAGVALEEVVEDWTDWVYAELDALHHWDVWFSKTMYRVWLLPDTLEIDIAFAPHEEFRSRGPSFKLVFGEARESVPPPPPEDVSQTVGLAWHHLLHVRSYTARGKVWQAEYWLSEARHHAMTLACMNRDLPVPYARGFDALPGKLLEQFKKAIPASLEHEELMLSLQVVTRLLLDEMVTAAPDIAERIRGPLLEIAALSR